MTIFVTQFDWKSKDKTITVPSTDSGFKSLADVERMMGPNWITKSNRLVLYRGTAFSDYNFGGDYSRLRIPM